MGVHKSEKIRKDTLQAIEEFIGVNGESPTYEELAKKLRVHPSTAFYRVSQLQKAGIVKVVWGEHRNIRLKEMKC